MANYRADNKSVTNFLLGTCRSHQWLNYNDLQALNHCVARAIVRGSSDDDETGHVPMTTGSVAEFYIEPMLSCVDDVDIMIHRNNELAIPAGTAPPTQLPDEFHSHVEVCEIVDSEFTGYVYLVLSYLLRERIDDGKYNAVECLRQYLAYEVHVRSHGPAIVTERSAALPSLFDVPTAGFTQDTVFCIRCLSWPPQASDWPMRPRSYSWPDSATIDHIVSNGCDVVRKAHYRYRVDEWMNVDQWRLSFSRAEIVLLNKWMTVQQIVYHMLRIFIKIERLTESATNSDVATLSNYHIKTLMLWACEKTPRSWWINDLDFVRLSVELLHTLGVWLTDARCPHYFIHNCNLFDNPDNCYHEIARRLMSETEASLANWFTNSYIRKCAQLCPDKVSRLFDDITNRTELQKAVVDWRLNQSLMYSVAVFATAQCIIPIAVYRHSLTMRSCLCLMKDLATIDQRLSVYFAAFTFLHVAYKITRDPLKDNMLDVLAITCLQHNDVRCCLNTRHSSVLSLSQAAKLMKVVANASHSTVQLIEIEPSKAYLHRALKLKNSGSVYCLAHTYLAVLYYVTGHYQTAIDHCTLVTMLQDHSQCRSHVVQSELLPKVDDNIDTALGLSVFYHYVRTAALNQQQQTRHVRVFTAELFAHYLHIRCLSVMKCRPLTQMSSTDEVRRYQKCLNELHEMFIADVMVIAFANLTKCPTNTQRQMAVSSQPKIIPEMSHPWDMSELLELLKQSAVEQLTAFRQREAQLFSLVGGIVTTDFEALYAYKCGEYQRCLQLSTQNVHMLIGVKDMPSVFCYPEFMQLMDDDIASLVGLTLIVNPSYEEDQSSNVNQLALSLYLLAQCHIKLHHSVTSLAQKLDYVKVARVKRLNSTFDHLLLKLTERKLLLYISRELA